MVDMFQNKLPIPHLQGERRTAKGNLRLRHPWPIYAGISKAQHTKHRTLNTIQQTP
jgi:hypothetical protein